VEYYNIHNIVTFVIKRTPSLAHKIFSHLDMEYDYFKVKHLDAPDMTVTIGDFTPDLKDCYLVDNKYYIKDDYIYFKDSYKLASWEAEITGFETGQIVVNIKSNFLGHLFYDGYIIEFLIKFIALQKGYCFLHAAGVAKDGKAVLFPARSGTGKTTLAMALVNDGWDYIGDDLVIVGTEGKKVFKDTFVYCYPTFIHVFDYHLTKTDIYDEHLTSWQKLQLKLKWLIYKATAGYAKLFSYFKLNEMFPETKIAKKSKVTRMIPVTKKDKSKFNFKVTDNEILNSLVLNMMIESYPFEHYRQAYAFIFPNSLMKTFWEDYEKTLENCLKRGWYTKDTDFDFSTYGFEVGEWNEQSVKSLRGAME